MSGEITDVLIMTHRDEDGVPKLPHLEALENSNPDVVNHIITGEDPPGVDKRFLWKNSDIVLRNWWRDNGQSVGENIFICEWDTLVTCKLPPIPDTVDLAGKQLITFSGKIGPTRWMKDPKWTDECWVWWKDLNKIPAWKCMNPCGLISFGAMFTRSRVMDSVSHKCWDHAYNLSLQNELRFPTVARFSGYTVGEVDLPHVRFDDVVPLDTPGIYHGVPTK